jgi:flagella basal body P-ring formation protein FlgA
MQRLTRPALVLLVLVLGAGEVPAGPAVGPALGTQAELEAVLGRYLAEAFPGRATEWSLGRRHPFEELTEYTFQLLAPETLLGGRNWFQLRGERALAGRPDREPDVKSFLLPVDVGWSDSVWVTGRALPAGHVLAAGDVDRRWLQHTHPQAAVDFPAPLGLVLRQGRRAGAVLIRDLLTAPPVVARGSMVRLIYRRGCLTVAARAEALESGAAGDEIRVRPLDSRRTCRGRVQGAQEVEVIVP